MTQLTVKIEDASMLEQIKQAISLLRGVVSVNVKKTKPKEYDITKTAGFREAMDDIEHGRVSTYDSVDDLFKELGISISVYEVQSHNPGYPTDTPVSANRHPFRFILTTTFIPLSQAAWGCAMRLPRCDSTTILNNKDTPVQKSPNMGRLGNRFFSDFCSVN